MNTQINQGVAIISAGRGVLQSLSDLAQRWGLAEVLAVTPSEAGLRLTLRSQWEQAWMPAFDTLALAEKSGLQPFTRREDLEQEIVVAMCGSPYRFDYPSVEEFLASVHIRRNIVQAARRTALSFHTSKIERPEAYWTYNEDYGFLLQPDKTLIDALRMATQPEVSGQQYAFSCYRASEYVIVLGIAQELQHCNPALLERLQAHWRSRAIMSRKFHDTFLYEYGSQEAPLPPKFYVPGDRLWFRNPDEYSSDVEGYEGSWVIYLGSGLFTNFWVCDKPYSLLEKCIEIYHWRHGVEKDAAGQLHMNEAIVEAKVSQTLADPAETARIFERMMRLRDPSGVYAEGGCIDTSREYPRYVCPGTADMVLPIMD